MEKRKEACIEERVKGIQADDASYKNQVDFIKADTTEMYER